jgi:hypothetical protein
MKKSFIACLGVPVLLLILIACGQSPATPTSVAVQPTATANPVLARLAPNLPGLDLDTFLFESYRVLLLRDPEGVTEAGLAGMLGMKEDQLGNRFDIKEFHNAVLSHGQLPLAVLEQVVQEYITQAR